ncbi:MAG: extracellular solute-binding protein [Oscillospiraceae bacterium]|jgi:putative aldouronate transport system substrate-binding protein|nr:extracellular solute-binding protein [Oscillospiraceae bacterium]
MKRVFAVLLALGLCLSIVPSIASAEELKPVKLSFVFFGDKKAAVDQVWTTIADTYRDRLNADFNIRYIPGDDYKTTLLLMAAAGESWDMNFDGNWLGYYQMIAMDAYLDLTALLPEYAPDLYAAYQESGALEAATYNGKIVALPWTMVMNNRTNFQWRGDLAKEAGIELNPEDITDFDDVFEALLQLNAAYPDRYTIEVSSLDAMKVKYSLADLGNNLVVDLSDDTPSVLALEATDAYREYAQYAKKLQDAGLIWKDVLNDKTDHNALIDQGKLITKWGTSEFARTNRAWVEEGAYWDYAFLYPDGKSPNRTPLANISTISATSDNPERVLMYMNLLQTDQALYDLMHYGIEGVTYELNGEEAVYPEGMNQANSNFMDWGGRWAFWKPQFMRPDASFHKDFWKEEEENAYSNPNNVVSPYDAFSLNADDISIETAQRDQTHADADKLISVGLAGDADAAVDKLIADQAANAAIIIAEAQKQLDAYLALRQ